MTTRLNNEIAEIPDHGVRELVKAVLKECPRSFWTVPAATSGKYHPASSLGEGGLIRHTIAVCRIARHLLELHNISGKSPLYSLVLAACLLHDCCKVPDGSKHSVHEHPLLAADLIRRVARDMGQACPCPLSTANEIAVSVATHMGRWTTSSRSAKILPEPSSFGGMLVHTADYLASRKDITLVEL